MPSKPSVLPGEYSPNSPRPRKRNKSSAPQSGKDSKNTGTKPSGVPSNKPSGTMSNDPSPVGRYKSLAKAFKKPGMQAGESDAVAAIMKKRGVSESEAQAIGARRTAKGLNVAGISGPNAKQKQAGRKPVKNPDPAFNKPGGPTKTPPADPNMPKPVPASTGGAPVSAVKKLNRPGSGKPVTKGRPVKMTGSGGKVYK